MLRGENTLLSMKSAYSADPSNPEIAAQLAGWFQDKYMFDSMVVYVDAIVADEDAASAVKGAFGPNGEDVSVYEYARALQVYNAPDKTTAFLDDFPQSVMFNEVGSLLARQLRNEEKRPHILDIFSDLQKSHPDNYSVFAWVVRFYASLNPEDKEKGQAAGIKQATILFERFKDQLAPDDLEALAAIFTASGDEEKAMQAYGPEYAQGLINAKDANGLNAYSWFWALQGANLDNALNAARKAVEFAPEDDNIWDTLSMVYWKKGMHEEAIMSEKRALELNPAAAKSYQDRIDQIEASMSSPA